MPKRKASGELLPSCKSLHIANMNPEDESPEPAHSSRRFSVQTGVSGYTISFDCPNVPESSESRERKVKEARDRVNRYVPGQQANDDKPMTCLNAFLDWLPEEGVDSVIHDAEKCGDNDESLFECFANLSYGLLYPMKTGRYRCVTTQEMDIDHWKSLNKPSNVMCGDLEAAHIIPFAYASWHDTPGEIRNVANVWKTLFRCFPSLRRTGMHVGNTNGPSNGITLRDILHKQFGKFRCAIEPTDTPHAYKLKTYECFPPSQRTLLPNDQKVTMRRAPGGDDVRLPSRDLLDCHWRVAVLNASGMGEAIDQMIRRWENIKEGDGHGCLRKDGMSDVSGFLKVAFWVRVAG
ncbi:hypothetical protein AJ80_09660 [Polytolypa hystricis UAMH7299]|uniref:HNH nuclease domain-containing protein n=1 Tax=Polytolypa hystricis (strain UAMH7299) TaxID=1447883 RepID=A0A2B7WMF1_POLH7|nr:hypothetical protein AJ80_09660 [Polytolypa hystricis UAMH7299]